MITSTVPGFEGICKPVWINSNSIDIRMNGGVSGFFRLLSKPNPWLLGMRTMTGEEFHGLIKHGTTVVVTTRIDDPDE